MAHDHQTLVHRHGLIIIQTVVVGNFLISRIPHLGLNGYIKENDVAPLHLSGIFPTDGELSRREIHAVALQGLTTTGHGNMLHDLFEESVCLLKRKGRGFLPPLFFSCQLLPGVCTPVEQKQEGT